MGPALPSRHPPGGNGLGADERAVSQSARPRRGQHVAPTTTHLMGLCRESFFVCLCTGRRRRPARFCETPHKCVASPVLSPGFIYFSQISSFLFLFPSSNEYQVHVYCCCCSGSSPTKRRRRKSAYRHSKPSSIPPQTTPFIPPGVMEPRFDRNKTVTPLVPLCTGAGLVNCGHSRDLLIPQQKPDSQIY